LARTKGRDQLAKVDGRDEQVQTKDQYGTTWAKGLDGVEGRDRSVWA